MDRLYDTQRVEMFTDAILAVAITLMVLRIDPPQPAPGETIGQAFASDTVPLIIYFPQFASYFFYLPLYMTS